MTGVARRLVNLCFHGIGAPGRELEPGEATYWIGTDLFESVLDEVAGRPDVVLSFDDGNASDVELGLPRLQERGLRATFFVLAGRLDLAGSLGREDVVRLRDAGMTVGTHGMDHHSWRHLDEQARRRELEEARTAIAEVVGRPVDEAALPLGQYDRTTLRALRRAGYRRVHTSDRRPARPGAWLQPRYSIRGEDTLESLRREVLSDRPWPEVLRREAVGAVKSLR